MSFVDKVRIHCRAGSGGDGCLSFRREKFIEFGGPDGGDGGRGGDIYLAADRNRATLLDFTYAPHLIAASGGNGKGSQKTGAGAPDLTALVPVGTVVRKGGAFLADLSGHGGRVLVARGGRGGRGNLSFKTHRNTAPRIAEKGEPGEEAEVELELKLIADVGLVGFPNAGKSSLLARVSNARPKVADYPFTTLAPHLGLVRHKGVDFVAADIPGLIEGAHSGKGLGHEFLRHVERTRLLVHLVDPLGYGGASALEGVGIIESELRSFSRVLSAKPRLLVVNKLDLPEGPGALRKLRARFRSRRIFAISAATGDGVGRLLDFLARELSRLARARASGAAGEEGATGSDAGSASRDGAPRPVRMRRGFEVVRDAGAFRVAGPDVERMAAMTNLALPEAVERFQRTMKRIGVDKSLRKAGVRAGDVVRIGPVELEWADEPPRGRR